MASPARMAFYWGLFNHAYVGGKFIDGNYSGYTPSGREPFGAVIRLKGSLFEGAGWPLGQTEGVSQGDAEL